MSRTGDPEARFITIDGERYSYRRSGEGHAILLLHGVTDSSRFYWREFFRSFESEYTVVAMDLRGHGDSEKPRCGYSAADQAQLVAKFLDGLELDRPILLGHSLGGIIAARFALLFPDKVSKLIICDSPLRGGFRKDLKWATQLPLSGAMIVGALMIPGLGRFLFSMRSPQTIRLALELLQTFSDPSHIPEEIIREKMKASYEAVSQSLWQAVIFENLDKDLHRISVPTLIIRGADDALVPQDQAEKAASRIPDSQLVIIDSAGHFPLLEQPEQFKRAVSAFLSSTE